MGVGGQRHDPPAFTPGKDPVPILMKVLGTFETSRETIT